MAETSNHHHTSFRDPGAPESLGAAPSFVWSDARLVGFGPMDSTHEEFYKVAFDLLTSNKDTAREQIAAFELHALDHFEQEASWMRSTGFPGTDCHLDEHAAVLQSTRQVREGFAAREIDLATVHEFALQLFAWFPGHADYMDSALASWMTQKTRGGRPVVLRRSLRRS
jgi:hemerythrin-like metal-binding protein